MSAGAYRLFRHPSSAAHRQPCSTETRALPLSVPSWASPARRSTAMSRLMDSSPRRASAHSKTSAAGRQARASHRVTHPGAHRRRWRARLIHKGAMTAPEATQLLIIRQRGGPPPQCYRRSPVASRSRSPLCEARPRAAVPPGERELRHLPGSPHCRKKFKKTKGDT